MRYLGRGLFFNSTVTGSTGYFLRNLLSVFANRARCPSLPGFLAAVVNFPAGMVLPALIPRDFRSAPGFLIAALMNFLAMLL